MTQQLLSAIIVFCLFTFFFVVLNLPSHAYTDFLMGAISSKPSYLLELQNNCSLISMVMTFIHSSFILTFSTRGRNIQLFITNISNCSHTIGCDGALELIK